MKVLHVIPSLSPKHGGPSFALPLIARSLVAEGIHVDIATTDDDGPGLHVDQPLEQPVERDGYRVFFFRKQLEFYKISPAFDRWMAQHAGDYELIHIHALFSYTSCRAARHAFRRQVPYIIRPLGVLNRWGMRNRRRLLKSLSFAFVETPILRRAAAIHYTSRQEKSEAADAGTSARPLVIPLGLDLEPFQRMPAAEDFLREHSAARDRRILLFLSRVDDKKGLDILLPAFARLHRADPRTLLVIAGSGARETVEKFRRLAEAQGISGAILWPGFLDGERKLAALAAADVFVLPSYSENFGIAAVEALAAGVPVVLSDGVAIADDVVTARAGLVTRPDPVALANILSRLFADDQLRQECSRRARMLVAERFSLEVMGCNLHAAYREIAGSSVSG